MKIISADQRLTERRGVKAVIVGPPGVGKTSQLRTLDPATTLFLDGEAGDLAVQDVPSTPFSLLIGLPRATSLAGSAAPIRRTRQRPATRRRTTKRSADRSTISINIKSCSSTASPRSAG
jgi:hypothetical protein